MSDCKIIILTLNRKLKVMDVDGERYMRNDSFIASFVFNEPYLIVDIITPPGDYHIISHGVVVGLTTIERFLWKKDIFAYRYLEDVHFRPEGSLAAIDCQMANATQLA